MMLCSKPVIHLIQWAIWYFCSLVAVVFKDTALGVNPVFQLHAKGIPIFPRMCVNEVNFDIPWVPGQLLGYAWFYLQRYGIFPQLFTLPPLGSVLGW